MVDLSYPLLMFLMGLAFALSHLRVRRPIVLVVHIAGLAWVGVLWTESYRLRLAAPDLLVHMLGWSGIALMVFAIVKQLRTTLRAPDANGITPPR